MDAAVAKLQEALDSESETDLFDGSTIAYMGPVYAGKLFVDFNEGETPA
jgi:tartrate dehydratase beta subunit/fumarate hydratase class I family protein